MPSYQSFMYPNCEHCFRVTRTPTQTPAAITGERSGYEGQPGSKR
jgi:hypothetical protein